MAVTSTAMTLTPAPPTLGTDRSISPGCALARAALPGFTPAAKDIAEHGRFDALADLPAMNAITPAFSRSQ
jgi:hypothetical protein